MAERRWDRLWIGGHLATMAAGADAPFGTIRDGALAAKDGHIAFVGAAADLPGRPENLADEVVALDGRWLLPGLIDCHTHLVYAGNRSDEFARRLAGESYADIARSGGGILATVRATRSADENNLFESARKRLLPFLAEGVTTVEIKSGYGLETESELTMLRAARRLGEALPVRVRTTFLGAHALPPEFTDDRDGYLDLVCDKMLPAAHQEGLADAVDAFCENIAFSTDEVGRLFDKAHSLDLPVKLHAEQLSDSGGAILAARHGALSADHLEYLDETGARALAEAGTVAVLLPGAFYFLGETRLPPVATLRRLGIPMAVASDANPGSSPVGSLLLMLNMACTLFKLTPEEALAGVTRNAAMALGLETEIGSLEIGKAADLAIYDIETPVDLAYSVGGNPCTSIVKDGRPVHGQQRAVDPPC